MPLAEKEEKSCLVINGRPSDEQSRIGRKNDKVQFSVKHFNVIWFKRIKPFYSF